MNNSLYSVNVTWTNGYLTNILIIISLAAILCGVLVIISKNPIFSVLFLIGLFASIASYLILIGLRFIGLAYLIVYVGAVSILFLFILMLINIRISELQSNTSNTIPLGFYITIVLTPALFELLPYDIAMLSKNLNNYNSSVFFVTSNTWDGNLAESGHMASIGNVMYTNYNMWLLMASLILLLAMVGAIVITIKQPSPGTTKLEPTLCAGVGSTVESLADIHALGLNDGTINSIGFDFFFAFDQYEQANNLFKGIIDSGTYTERILQ